METEAVSLFREFTKYPEVKGARFVESGGDNCIGIDSLWTQRCLEKNEAHKFRLHYLLKDKNFELIFKSYPQLNGESVWNLTAPSAKRSVIVRKHTPDKAKPTDEKWFFEIWSHEGYCERVLELPTNDKHGDVYNKDGAFGSLAWNYAEDKIAYVAEKKKAKGCSYFDKMKKNADDKLVPGTKFLHKSDWGEMLVGKEQPVVCILDIVSGEVTVVEENLMDMSCGQVVWCPDGKGIVFCAFSQAPFRLGITHCPIRRSIIYHYDLETSALKPLTSTVDLSVRSPRFSPDGSKMVYLECKSGGPHCVSQRLRLIDWSTGASRTVVDVLDCPAAQEEFQGIYSQHLSYRCWNASSTHVILSTTARSAKHVFSIEVSTNKVTRLTNTVSCWHVYDIRKDHILASMSSIDLPPRLAIGSLQDLEAGKRINWIYLDPENRIPGIKWEVMEHKPTIPHSIYSSLTYESVVLHPADLKSKGLIVFPHGGPHSVFSVGYQIYFASLVRLGFTVALVNFRGSTGFGESSILSLIGYIGDADIKDVHQAALEVLDKYQLDREKVVVLGGSHGGFIAAHLIGQYPDFYKAAVIRNPVTNLVSMVALTDIPDWVHVEANIVDYVPGTVPTSDVYSRLLSKSPVAYIDNAKTPTMVMLGQDDRRVPPSQGEEFHKALLVKGVECSLYVYPDNSHPIISVEAESDSLVNLCKWFATHLGLSA